ncbi:MAG: phosphate/phosphite/phosphonate ABC transporter substrate-binding protein [Nostocaceae cyanobacterium]|nr:phosphate/phosphite/phosphonate ABC transporter substrate-binding protein [Nostocaceae cyanobacterium]
MSLWKKVFLNVSAAAVVLAGCGVSTVAEQEASADSVPSQQAQNQNLVAQNAPMTTLKIAFPSRADSTDLQNKANAVATFLSKELGMKVEAIVADDTAAVEALRANRVDVSFLSSRPALKAEQLANSRMYLAEVRKNYSGGHTYKSIFVVPKDSPLQSKSSAKQTLEQLRGKRMTFTSPTSGSGFIFPVGELVKEGLVPSRDKLDSFFGQVAYGNGYSGALQAVLRGQADVAAVSEYTLGAPYITAEEAKKLRVLHSISNVPAHGIVIDDDVPAATREKIINALMKLNEPANNQLLTSLYNSTNLVKVDHSKHLEPMREALKRAGIEQ